MGDWSTSGDIGGVQLEELRRLVIHPGETLVATVPVGTHRELIKRLADDLRTNMPDGVGTLVITNDIQLDVVTTKDKQDKQGE